MGKRGAESSPGFTGRRAVNSLGTGECHGNFHQRSQRRDRSYATEKAEKISHLADKALAFEVKVSRHNEKNGSSGDDRVELTLIGPGPLVRAESNGSDKYVALDLALDEIAAAGFTHVSNPCEGSSTVPSYNLQMLDLAEVALQATAGVARGFHHDVDKG